MVKERGIKTKPRHREKELGDRSERRRTKGRELNENERDVRMIQEMTERRAGRKVKGENKDERKWGKGEETRSRRRLKPR